MNSPSKSVAEGRAILARPSLRLIFAVAAVISPVLLAPVARAEQPEPVALTETNPHSSAAQPAASTTPSIIGRGDGAIISVLPPFGKARSPVPASGTSPTNEVDIYANANCSGAPAANGIVDELEGTKGIQVKVVPDSATTFSAVQIDPSDPGNPSICSKPITYWNGSTGSEEPPAKEPLAEEPPTINPPPTAAPPPSDSRPGTTTAPLSPRLRTAPSGTASDNSPQVLGSAPGADSVRIFTNSSCSGTPAAKVSPADLAAGVELRVADDSVTDFTGISSANGKQSSCSPPATYTEDSTPPRTHITMGPGAKTRHRKVTFRFADVGGDPVGTSFVCRLDSRRWKPCHSPFKLRHLDFKRHVIRVLGSDPVGNVEAKAAKRSFKVIH